MPIYDDLDDRGSKTMATISTLRRIHTGCASFSGPPFVACAAEAGNT